MLAATLRRGKPRRDAGRKGSGDADADVAAEVEAAMRRLGLTECADTLVVRRRAARMRGACLRGRSGSAAAATVTVGRCVGCGAHARAAGRPQGGESSGHVVTGISGGERRRLAIGASPARQACARRIVPHIRSLR